MFKKTQKNWWSCYVEHVPCSFRHRCHELRVNKHISIVVHFRLANPPCKSKTYPTQPSKKNTCQWPFSSSRRYNVQMVKHHCVVSRDPFKGYPWPPMIGDQRSSRSRTEKTWFLFCCLSRLFSWLQGMQLVCFSKHKKMLFFYNHLLTDWHSRVWQIQFWGLSKTTVFGCIFEGHKGQDVENSLLVGRFFAEIYLRYKRSCAGKLYLQRSISPFWWYFPLKITTCTIV